MIALPQLALYGGSFDPVHNAHLHLLHCTNAALAPQRLVVLPCHQPPHKGAFLASNEDRLAMLELALKDLPNVSVDQRELRRDSLSYTYTTVQEYRQEEGGKVSITFVIGGDSWLDFTSWHQWRELFGLVNLLVLKRPGVIQQAGLGESHRQLEAYYAEHQVPAADLTFFSHGKVAMLDNSELDIASNTIRAQISRGDRSYRDCVPSEVADYIESKGLYSQQDQGL